MAMKTCQLTFALWKGEIKVSGSLCSYIEEYAQASHLLRRLAITIFNKADCWKRTQRTYIAKLVLRFGLVQQGLEKRWQRMR